MDGGLVPVAVPGASPEDLAAALEQLHVVGSAIDGASLGIDGVAVARLVGGDDDVLVMRDDDTHAESITAATVLAHLAFRWPDAMVGDAAVDEYELCWPILVVRGLRTVAVTPPADLMLPLFAKSAGVALHEARVGDRLLVGIADGHELPVDVLVDVLANAKGRSVVLWRTDTHTGLHVMKRSKHAEAHMWEPSWTPFGHPALDELRDPGLTGDAAAIGKLLDLSAADIVSLRAMLRRPQADLAALVDLLDLPSVVVDVLEGRTTVAELPGGTMPEAKGLIATAVQGSEYDPAWVRWVERGSRELRPWYVISSLLSIVLGVAMVVAWRSGGSAFWGVLGLVITLGTVIDLPVRWSRKRRRMAS